MITKSPLSLDELATMTVLLNRYVHELVYEANEGVALDEDPRDTAEREIAIEKIESALNVAREDLQYRLETL